MMRVPAAVETTISVRTEADPVGGEVRPRPPAVRGRVVLIEVTALLVVVAAYTAFQRVGTTANADRVEFTKNLAGGFLAVGLTDDQPGFIVLSVLDREKVDIDAKQVINRVAGTHTVASVHTDQSDWSRRLRGPQVVIIDEAGRVTASPVDWTVDEFNGLRDAADCEHADGRKVLRCGAPFADLSEALSTWPDTRVPKPVRAFLTRYSRSSR